MTQSNKTSQQNIDPEEIAKFEELANKWWDRNSEFKPLHDINPLRVGFIDRIAHLADKNVLDVGCGGGGLLSLLETTRGVDGRGIEISQTGVNACVRQGLSVVQGDADTLLPQHLQRRVHPGACADERALGQLQAQPLRGQAAGVQHAGDQRHEVTVGQLTRGQVHVHRQLVVDPCGGPAGRGEHQPVDVDDQAAVLGHVDELCRQEQLVVTLPAHEGLDGDGVPGDGIDDRLVLHDQLVVAERGAQPTFEVEATTHRGGQAVAVHADRRATSVLGGVHGQVGPAHEVVGVGTVLGDHDPDRAGDDDLVVVDQQRLADVVADAVGDGEGLQLTQHPVAQDDELVAAHACDRVPGPEAVQQAIRDPLQQPIADLVPTAVVDQLEPVEVEEQQRHT